MKQQAIEDVNIMPQLESVWLRHTERQDRRL